ncbi:hypothetical protein WAK64_17775 [Bacillus spongiae]|uniref:Uncharacterized protein n=1 Tax=Bacillus spongiae TaxID=2683610 RepID=A0ABU8HI12_9BACI
MKGFILGIISVFLTVIIHEGVLSLIGFNYALFSDEFNFLSLLVDLGLFVAIFMPIYLVAKKFIFRKAH